MFFVLCWFSINCPNVMGNGAQTEKDEASAAKGGLLGGCRKEPEKPPSLQLASQSKAQVGRDVGGPHLGHG